MYINLHTHTHYSVLDGHSTPEEYMARAKDLGMSALAITDHGTMSGHRAFQKAAKEAGIKPILGVEAYLANDVTDRRTWADREPENPVYSHLTVLAQNEQGLQLLNKHNERAWNEGFYQKPRIQRDWLLDENSGLVVLSGCMSGDLAKAILRGEDGLPIASEFKEALGDRYFIEIMSSNETELNLALLDVANKLDIPVVMTQDSHYAHPDDLWVTEAMLILSTNPKAARFDFAKSQQMDMLDRFNYIYPDRKMTFAEIKICMRTYQSEVEKFAEQGIDRTDIYTNTLAIADTIEEYPFYEGLDLLPSPTNENPDEVLARKARSGLISRGMDKDEAAVKRLREELDIFKQKKFSAYMLIVEDAVSFARQSKIRMTPGRGSGCASLVNYALYNTNINPLKYDLPLFRFIDPHRADYPDIDLDFMDTRREEVKEYMRRRYENVASIITFGYFKGKGAVRSAARVFKVPLGDVNKALKGVHTFEQFMASPDTQWFRQKYPEVVKLATKLRGRIEKVGIHAGGLVLSKEPISKYAPMQTATNPKDPTGPRIPVVAYDMKEVAEIGMIKFDFLGVSAETVVDKTLALIKERRQIDIDIDNISLDCKEVYEELSQGHTKGNFQVEQPAYTGLILKMGGVKTFDELVASNALVRPGAANSTVGEDYIRGKNGGQISYIHPDVRWFTEKTYGTVLYQEDQMLLCVHLAGMTMEEASAVRKCIGKKLPEELAKWKDRFVTGAAEKVGVRKANKVWKDLEAAGDYAFNLSHSVAYSTVTYQMAWLKYHFPIEFMTASLASESDKDRRMELLMEAKRLGLKIALPHVNESDISFSIQSDAEGEFIRMGLADIKYLSNITAYKLIQRRPFKSMAELRAFADKLKSGVNSRQVQALDKVGAAIFEDNPLRGDERQYFYEYLNIPAFEIKDIDASIKEQLRPLEDFDSDSTFVCMAMVKNIKMGTGWVRLDMVDETGQAGVFINPGHSVEPGNMYIFLVSNNSVIDYINTNDFLETDTTLKKYLQSQELPIAEDEFAVVKFKPRKTKAGKNMATVIFSDKNKELSPALVFDKQFPMAYTRCKESNVVRPVFGETKDGTRFIATV